MTIIYIVLATAIILLWILPTLRMTYSERRSFYISLGSVGTILLFIFSLTSATKDGLDLAFTYIFTQSSEAIPSNLFAPKSNDEVLVIIAPFDGKEDINPQERIATSLSDEIKSINDIGNVRVERYSEVIRTSESKAKLAQIKEIYKPSIIIWGWFDKFGITTHFEIQEEHFFDKLLPATSEGINLPSNEDKFVTYVTKHLPQQMTNQVSLAIAGIYFSTGNYDPAHVYLCRAIKNMPAGPQKEELITFRGWTIVLGMWPTSFPTDSNGSILACDEQ